MVDLPPDHIRVIETRALDPGAMLGVGDTLFVGDFELFRLRLGWRRRPLGAPWPSRPAGIAIPNEAFRG